MADSTNPPVKDKKKLTINLSMNYKIVAIILALLLIVSIAFWRPWVRDATNRTISITGQSTVNAETDQFTFNPSWTINAGSDQASLNAVAVKSNEVVAGLKAVGVEDKNIKVSSSGAAQYDKLGQPTEVTEYYLNIEVKVPNKEQAQKVQDYLITTGPSGQFTPFGSFTEAKQKELEAQARDEATKDAKEKADQTAKNLGFKIGKIKIVSDLQMPYPIMAADTLGYAEGSVSVQPGTSDLTYSITVEYYIK